MSKLAEADNFLYLALEALRHSTPTDPETGEWVLPEGEMAQAALKAVEGARRLVQRAGRDRARAIEKAEAQLRATQGTVSLTSYKGQCS